MRSEPVLKHYLFVGTVGSAEWEYQALAAGRGRNANR
jgi:hypothetical protein